MRRLILSACLAGSLLLSATAVAIPATTVPTTTYTKFVTGKITNIKTDSPYPFFFKNWECKLRITYLEQEPDGEYETYVYKAYPLINIERSNRWMCLLQTGLDVTIETRYKPKSPLRGEIISLTMLNP